jgi:hypothetical protein
MKNRRLERLKRKRMRHEKNGITTPIDPITGEDIGLGAENHHIAGRKYHDDTIPLMPTGHHMLNDAFRDTSGSLPGPVHELERMGRYTQGVIIILDFVLDREWEHAERLISMGRSQSGIELTKRKGRRKSDGEKARRPRRGDDDTGT